MANRNISWVIVLSEGRQRKHCSLLSVGAVAEGCECDGMPVTVTPSLSVSLTEAGPSGLEFQFFRVLQSHPDDPLHASALSVHAHVRGSQPGQHSHPAPTPRVSMCTTTAQHPDNISDLQRFRMTLGYDFEGYFAPETHRIWRFFGSA